MSAETTTTTPTEETTGPAPETAATPTPEAGTLAEIVAMDRDILELRSDHQQKHAAAKAAKELLEEAQERLNDFIADLGREYPLFDGAKPEAVPAPATDLWRAVPIADLGRFGLTPTITKKLGEAGIETMGALADFTGADKRLTDLKGIGAAAAEKIDAASTAFWEAMKLAAPLVDSQPAEGEAA